jgi:hemerythrin
MANIIWNDTYSVGVKAMDEQHKKLVAMANQLHEAMGAGKGREVLEPVLNEMIEYTKLHFTAEEKLLAKYNYPGLDAQKREHEAFFQKVAKMQTDLKAKNLTLSIELSQFLRSWISSHILGIDKEYTSFLNSRGEK